MKTPTEHLVDEVKNWSFDDWKVLRNDPKLLSNVLSSVQKAAPEVFENVLRTVMIPPVMNNPKVNSILGEWEREKEPEDDDYEDYTTPEEDAAMEKRLEEEEAARLEEDERERKHKKLVNTVTQNYNDHPEYMDHFGEEQAEGLGNILEGLRDTPHDDRW